MEYTLYSPEIGEILGSGSCPDGADISYHGLPYIEGLFSPDEYYVNEGRPISKGTRPSNNHVFNYLNKCWEDPRTLDDFKKEKQFLLKNRRDAAEFGPFIYNGMSFDGDLDAQRRLSVLASAAKTSLAAGHSFTKDFTLVDNTVVQLTAEDFIGIEMAKLWQVDVAFQEYRLKRAAIEAATTLEELEAIPV